MAEIIGMGMSELKDWQAARELGADSQIRCGRLKDELHKEVINSRARRSRIRRHLYRHPEELREDYWH